MISHLPKPKNKKGSGRISRYGLLFDSWRQIHSNLNNMYRSTTLPTFDTPFEGLFLDDAVDVSWGRITIENIPLSYIQNYASL